VSAAAELDSVPAGPVLVPAGVPVRSGRVHVGRLCAALPRSGRVRVLAGFRTVAWLGGPEDSPPGLGPMPYRGTAEVDGRGRVVLDRQARAWLAVTTPGAFGAVVMPAPGGGLLLVPVEDYAERVAGVEL
jgi:hypothetical protein